MKAGQLVHELYCAHHDDGAPFLAAAMTRSSSAPRKNSCPRNGADGNRDITSTVTRARGLHPVARCDDVLQLAVIFLLGHTGRRSHVARAVQVLFDPWALSTFVAVDVLLLAPVLRDPRVSKNCCKAIGCSSVAMSPLLKKAKPTSTWL